MFLGNFSNSPTDATSNPKSHRQPKQIQIPGEQTKISQCKFRYIRNTETRKIITPRENRYDKLPTRGKTGMAGPVGYAQCSERILTFSSSMGIKFYPPNPNPLYHSLSLHTHAHTRAQSVVCTGDHGHLYLNFFARAWDGSPEVFQVLAHVT